MDKSSESALDNSNVIYDNDSEHINPTNQAASTTSAGGPSSNCDPPQSASTAAIAGPIKPSSIGTTQQDVSKSTLKQLMVGAAANKATAGSSSQSSTSSFVHREHADESQEQQDNYATCLLTVPTEPSSAAATQVNISKLAGRLNFWQPIQNRGVAHMIARLRYEYNSNNSSKDITTSTKLDSSQQLRRRRRESFQSLIERAPPAMKDQNETTMSRPSMGNQLVHQVWLHDDDCTNAVAIANVNKGETQVKRKLLAELKAIVVNGTIDMDSELIIGHLNLAETNSILNKCLRISLLLIDNSALTPREQNKDLDTTTNTSNSQQQQPQRQPLSQPNELLVGYCKIVQSDSLPPVSELEQSPSVASNIQPLREDLLVSGSSLSSSSSSSSASTINKTAPNNRKALFELM